MKDKIIKNIETLHLVLKRKWWDMISSGNKNGVSNENEEI